MMRLAPLMLLICSAPSALDAVMASEETSLKEYLAVRKQHGVVRPVTLPELDQLVGKRVVEVKGTVRGSFQSGAMASIMLRRADGKDQVVDANSAPEWLLNSTSPVRLLVSVDRSSQEEMLRLNLVAAAHDAEIARYDASATAKVAASAPKKTASQATSASKSKNSGLTGPIGRGAPLASRGGSRKDWVLPSNEVTPVYAAYIKKINKRLSDAEAIQIAESVVGFSMHYGVDARLVMAILIVESGFNPDSVSRAGAMGLGQLMPGTAKWMGVSDPFDTTQNLYGTVKLLRRHLDTYRAKSSGDDLEALVLSLAAYNAGAGAVKRHGGVPPYRETQQYVRKVIALYYRLAGHS